MDENQIEAQSDKMAKALDSGYGDVFRDESNALLDQVKAGEVTPAEYNKILRQAEGKQVGDKKNWYAGFNEFTLTENCQDITLNNGKTAKVDGGGLVYRYSGEVRNQFDAQGNRR